MPAVKGSKPWNWRGEPIIEPRGYVLIFVGKDHPLADCRGYAYEHRLIADARKKLEPGEMVHHDNENKGDNHPENLIVARSRAEHALHHRRSGKELRLPGEHNPYVSCACGCGAPFKKYDSTGRPRRYVSGHNPRARGGDGRFY